MEKVKKEKINKINSKNDEQHKRLSEQKGRYGEIFGFHFFSLKKIPKGNSTAQKKSVLSVTYLLRHGSSHRIYNPDYLILRK